MKLSRTSRLVAAVITLCSILFMQVAVAAYACPALATGQGHAPLATEVPMGEMTDCNDVDPAQPSLCHAHHQVGNQSLDKPAAPVTPSFVAVGSWFTLIPDDTGAVPPSVPRRASLSHATAPPVAIRHCCLRI